MTSCPHHQSLCLRTGAAAEDCMICGPLLQMRDDTGGHEGQHCSLLSRRQFTVSWDWGTCGWVTSCDGQGWTGPYSSSWSAWKFGMVDTLATGV